MRLYAAPLLAAFALAGCRTLPPSPTNTTGVAQPTPAVVETCSFFDGSTGQRLDWISLTRRIAAADIILVGEQHDNEPGHRLEAALVDTVLRHTPRAAVALEMFERHEQGFVDAYLDGGIAATTLMTLTESENWGGGKNTWMDWYQPIVDQVKERRSSGAGLIAANAPRSFAKLARLEGFSALNQLPPAERRLFTVPNLEVDDRAYRERFLATMSQHATQAKEANATAPTSAMSGKAESFFRAQQIWDATMADSVLHAYRQHPKVLLVVGEFHVGFSGGTFVRVRYEAPKAKITTLSILRSDKTETLANTDKDRADIVVYTHPAP